MTLPALLAHVAARWAVTRTPTCGRVPDESEIEMNEHRTRVVLCRSGQYGYCTCGWVDIMRPDDGTAFYSAAMHRRETTA